MDEDITARVEATSQLLAAHGPFRLELDARRAHVTDRQMQPDHASALNFRPQVRNASRDISCGSISVTTALAFHSLSRAIPWEGMREFTVKQEGNSVHLQSGEKAADFNPEGEIYSEGGKVLRVWHRAKPG